MRIRFIFLAVLLTRSAFAVVPETVTLDVQNMRCAACPITIKKALQQTPGVSDVKVDFAHKTVTLQRDIAKASNLVLIKATTDAGFPSTVRK